MKRVITAILAAVMILGMMPLAAFAADWGEGDTIDDALSELKVGFSSTQLDWLALPNLGIIRQRYTYFMFKNERTGTIDEKPVYCIDPTRGGAHEIVMNIGPNPDDGSNTATYIRGEKVGDARYKAILASGYPHFRYESFGLETREEAYYATKLALWMYIQGNNPNNLTINPAYGNSDPVALRVRNAAITIFNNGMADNTLPEPSLTLTGKPNAIAKLDTKGEYYVQEIEICASAWVGTNPDKCGDVQLSWGSAPPSGTIVLGSKGEDITSSLKVEMGVVSGSGSFGWYGKATIKYPAVGLSAETFSPPTLKAEALISNDEIYIAYAKAGQNYYQRYLVERDPKILVKTDFVSQLSWGPNIEDFPEDSGLRIRKLEAGTNLPLAGAVFEIHDPDGKLIYSLATNDSGIIDIPLSVMGNYTITEIFPPQFHLLPQVRTQNVTVKYGEVAEVTFTNAPYGTLMVYKRDHADGRNLSGAVIQLMNITTGAIQTATTDSSGAVTFSNLPCTENGTAYEIREMTAPQGYALDLTVHTVNVRPLTEGIISYTLTNKANAGIRITKFDRQTMTTIEGVTFEVWKDGELYGTYSTDRNGEILLTNIPAGTYTAREKITVEPYILDPTAQWIEVKAGQGYISELKFFNLQKPGMRLLKVDSLTLAPLTNARYLISMVGGTYSNEFTTDVNGEIDLSALEPGAYTVKELAAPNGYIIDDAIRTVQLNAGENAQFVFTNTGKPSIEILKFDAQNAKYLGGATFRIARIADGTHYLDRVTDANGKIRIDDLEPGIYSVQEIAPPSGYALNGTEYHVELFPGRTSQLVVNNVKLPALVIKKYDMLTAQPLPDTEFSVAKKGGEIVWEGLTGADGTISLPNLDEGWYTITELAPPPGYLPSTAPKDVYLEAGKTVEVKFDNLPCPTLTVSKTDSITHDSIKNVKFNVKFSPAANFTGGVIDLGNYLTDENGKILLNDKLQPGWYRVTELEPAAGYTIKAPISQDIYIKGGDNMTVHFENVPKSALIIRKIDSETGLPVQGATFTVRYLGGTSGSSGTIIHEGVTSINGTITLAGLAPGTYVVEETKPANGYELSNPSVQTAYIADNEQAVVQLRFENAKKGNLIITKLDSVTKLPLAGATFKVTDSSGAVIGPNNGIYTTDASGVINLAENLPIGSTIIVQEQKAPDGYLLDGTAQTVKIKENITHSLTFYNAPMSSAQIIKIDSTTKQPLKNAQFTVYKKSGEIVGKYTTNGDGIIILPALAPGWYKAVESKAPSGYVLDDTPQDFEITSNQFIKLVFENRPLTGFRIVKIDSITKKPIYNVEFMVFDSNNKVVGTYTTDNNGVIDFMGILSEGRYTIRETRPADGYYRDDMPRTVEFRSGKVTEIVWENTPQRGQIQITKLSGDDNEVNGLEKGTPLAGAIFEVYEYKSGNLVDRFVSGTDGRAVSKPLPLGRYIIKEVQAPKWYRISTEVIDVDIEFATQIIKLNFLNYSANTGVKIRKTGNYEAMPGDTIRYDIREVRNTSTVPLTDFYWRDILPTDAVRLTKIVTGTYNQSLKYKILVTTNKGDTRVIADNLSTTQNNVINCSNAALGLWHDEYVTSFTLVFGTVKAGFAEVEKPQIYVSVLTNLPNGYQFANKADVGGKYGGEWVIGNTTWVTNIYAKPVKLPRTGY